MSLSRRHFLRSAAAVSAGFLGLRALHLDPLHAQDAPGYGDLVADPKKVISLPKDFTYAILSRTGETMDDGLLVPAAHDGMAAFPGPEGRTLLVRNHELTAESGVGPFGAKGALLEKIEADRLYDPSGCGGTTTLVFDTKAGRLEKHFLSLGGTYRNCAGGPTPWGSWITCEENTTRAGGRAQKDHGWCFEVPASAAPGLARATPLAGLGRFNHEAAAVDAKTGHVYLTEDQRDGLLYRFTPDRKGDLAAGGKLQALAIKGRPGADTSNDGKGETIAVGKPVDVEWVDLDGIDAPKDDLRKRGREKGAATFARGEGMWYGRDAVYFCCTSGGARDKGQVWRLAGDRLELFVEPNDAAVLENCDNITVAPWGDLVLCEDGPGRNALVGVTPAGRLYRLAENAMNTSEFAGACFSPDGTTLFVNIQTPGLTIAITGPWKK